MAYTKTQGYETTRQTSMETSISSGSVTSKSTRNEYSVPFNNYSAANHLIKAFTLSGVTSQPGDDPNGVYTKDNTSSVWTDDDSGTLFNLITTISGGFAQWEWVFVDTDTNPFSLFPVAIPTSNTDSADVGFIQDNEVYPWSDQITAWDDLVGDFGSNGVISNPVGSDFE
jgi:hypothetical protein